MATLITGGNGFVGRNLIKSLYKNREVFGEIITVSRRDCKSSFITKSYRCDLGFSDHSEAQFYGLRYIMRRHKPE